MENEKQTENFENQLTSAAVGFLQESAKWSKFMAIIGFIGIARGTGHHRQRTGAGHSRHNAAW